MTEMRIDKWLWATRVFKTRSLATDQCKLGRVTIKGMNVKPSHLIKVGDKISVKKSPITFTFEVVGLLNNRVGAKLVPNYLKNITTPDQYQLLDGREMKEFTEEAFFGFDDLDDENPLWTEEDEENLEQSLK